MFDDYLYNKCLFKNIKFSFSIKYCTVVVYLSNVWLKSTIWR